jgi:hypothetical protein
MRMRLIILSSVISLALSRFSKLTSKRHYFWKEITEHKMCFFILSATCVWNISYFKNNSAEMLLQMWANLRAKYLLFLREFIKTWILSIDFRKTPKIPNFMKIRPVEPELFHAERQTDKLAYEANSRFLRNFSNAPKNVGRDVIRPLSTYILTTRCHRPSDRNLNSFCSHNLILTRGDWRKQSTIVWSFPRQYLMRQAF